MSVVSSLNREITVLSEQVALNNFQIKQLLNENEHLQFTIGLLKTKRKLVQAKAWERRLRC